MAAYFFGSSALARRYHREAGTRTVDWVFQHPDSKIRISRLTSSTGGFGSNPKSPRADAWVVLIIVEADGSQTSFRLKFVATLAVILSNGAPLKIVASTSLLHGKRYPVLAVRGADCQDNRHRVAR